MFKCLIFLSFILFSSIASAQLLPIVVDSFSFEDSAGSFLDKCRLKHGNVTVDFTVEKPTEFTIECSNLHNKSNQTDLVFAIWSDKTHHISKLITQSYPDNVNFQKIFENKKRDLVKSYGSPNCNVDICSWKLEDGTVNLSFDTDDNSNTVVIVSYIK